MKKMGGMRRLVVCFERWASCRSKIFFKLPVASIAFGLADLFSLRSSSVEAIASWMCALSHSSNASIRSPFGAMTVSAWIVMGCQAPPG